MKLILKRRSAQDYKTYSIICWQPALHLKHLAFLRIKTIPKKSEVKKSRKGFVFSPSPLSSPSSLLFFPLQNEIVPGKTVMYIQNRLRWEKGSIKKRKTLLMLHFEEFKKLINGIDIAVKNP